MKKFLAMLTVFIFFLSMSLAYGFPAVEVFKKSAKSVVLIVSGDRGSGNLVGAGSVVTDDGLVVTNAHVVIDKRTSRPYPEIKVFTKPDEVTGNLGRDLLNRHGAEVLAYNTGLDLAVLRVRGLPRGLRVIKLADPGEILVGEEVVAIGHPEQGGLWSLTYGRISGQISEQGNVKGKDVYQTDTSVNRGNSGGPLLDRRGYMVGVNTNIARKGSGGIAITGVNFALKSSVVKHWLDRKGYRLAYGEESLHGEPEAAPARREATEEKEAVRKRREEKPVEPPYEEKRAAPEEAVELAETVDEDTKSDTILTPQKPYAYEDLFEEVEKEMEDMMEEMKRKFRGK